MIAVVVSAIATTGICTPFCSKAARSCGKKNSSARTMPPPTTSVSAPKRCTNGSMISANVRANSSKMARTSAVYLSAW